MTNLPVPHQNGPHIQNNLLPTGLDASDALMQIIRANGNINLAAERLRTTPGELTAVIAQDKVASTLLNEQVRVSTLLSIFHLVNLTKVTLEAVLPDLEPNDVSKTFASLVDAISRITEKQQQVNNVNVNEFIMRSLPPKVRKALVSIIDPADVE
jgi:hypothetical protein